MDKYDLFDHYIETHVNQLFECCLRKGETDKPSAKTAILRIFEFLRQHASIYSNMLTNKWSTAFRSHLHAVLEKMIEEQIDKKGIDQNINKDILVQYVASATVGVMEWWITNSMPYSPTEMVEQLGFFLERVQLVHQYYTLNMP